MLYTTFSSHTGYESNASAQGRPLRRLPFPGATYVMNHGESHSVQAAISAGSANCSASLSGKESLQPQCGRSSGWTWLPTVRRRGQQHDSVRRAVPVRRRSILTARQQGFGRAGGQFVSS